MKNDWIVCHPDVLGGKPCIRGTRISVEFILEQLAAGTTQAEFLDSFPHVPRAGFVAALQYAAAAIRVRVPRKNG